MMNGFELLNVFIFSEIDTYSPQTNTFMGIEINRITIMPLRNAFPQLMYIMKPEVIIYK